MDPSAANLVSHADSGHKVLLTSIAVDPQEFKQLLSEGLAAALAASLPAFFATYSQLSLRMNASDAVTAALAARVDGLEITQATTLAELVNGDSAKKPGLFKRTFGARPAALDAAPTIPTAPAPVLPPPPQAAPLEAVVISPVWDGSVAMGAGFTGLHQSLDTTEIQAQSRVVALETSLKLDAAANVGNLAVAIEGVASAGRSSAAQATTAFGEAQLAVELLAEKLDALLVKAGEVLTEVKREQRTDSHAPLPEPDQQDGLGGRASNAAAVAGERQSVTPTARVAAAAAFLVPGENLGRALLPSGSEALTGYLHSTERELATFNTPFSNLTPLTPPFSNPINMSAYGLGGGPSYQLHGLDFLDQSTGFEQQQQLHHASQLGMFQEHLYPPQGLQMLASLLQQAQPVADAPELGGAPPQPQSVRGQQMLQPQQQYQQLQQQQQLGNGQEAVPTMSRKLKRQANAAAAAAAPPPSAGYMATPMASGNGGLRGGVPQAYAGAGANINPGQPRAAPPPPPMARTPARDSGPGTQHPQPPLQPLASNYGMAGTAWAVPAGARDTGVQGFRPGNNPASYHAASGGAGTNAYYPGPGY